MATIERLVLEASVDPRGVKAGLDKALNQYNQFFSKIQKRAATATINPLGQLGRTDLARGLQRLATQLNATFSQRELSRRSNLAQGLIDEKQFAQQGARASIAFNQAWHQGVSRLAGQFPTQMTGRMEAAIAGTFKTTANQATAAFGKNLLLGKAANLQGGIAAEQMVRGLTNTLNAQRANISRQVATGILDPRAGRQMWMNAQAEFNRALASGISNLGPIGARLQEALTKQFRPAGFKAGEAAAAEARRAFTESQERLQSIGLSAQRAGQALTFGVTLPIVGIGAAIIKSAAEFERSMNVVRANANATTSEFIQLKQAARDLGAAAEFGPAALGSSMAILARAGFDTEQIIAGTPKVMALATAAQLDLARAADITASVMRSQGFAISEFGRVVDVFTKAAIESQADVNDLAVSFKYVGSIGRSVGANFEAITAALAAFSNAGFVASFAGTSMRGALSRLLSPSQQATRELKKLGLEIYDARKQMLPFSQIIRQLEEKSLSKTGDALFNAGKAFAIFGDRAGPGLAAMMTIGHEKILEFEAALRNSEGTADRVRRIQLEGMVGSLKRLKSQFEELTIAIGQTGLIVGLTGVIQRITVMVTQLSKANPAFFVMIGSFAIVAATLGPVLFAVGKFIGLLYILRKATFLAAGANAAFGATLAVTGPIAIGLILGTVLLYKWARAAQKAAEDSQKFRAAISELTSTQLQQVRQATHVQIWALEDLQKQQNKMTLPEFRAELLKRGIDGIKDMEVKLQAWRDRLTEVNAQLKENSAFADDARKVQSDLTAVMQEALLAMQGATGVMGEAGESATTKFSSGVSALIERLEALRSLQLDTTGVEAALIEKLREAQGITAATGNNLKVQLQYLQAQVDILDALKDPFEEEALKLARILQIRVDLAQTNFADIIAQLQELQERIAKAVTKTDVKDVKAMERLSRAYQVVLRSLEMATDKMIGFSTRMERQLQGISDLPRTNVFRLSIERAEAMNKAFEDLTIRWIELKASWGKGKFVNPNEIFLSAKLAIEQILIATLESIPTPAEALTYAFKQLVSPVFSVAREFARLPRVLASFVRGFSPGKMLEGTFGQINTIVSAIAESMSPIVLFGAIFGRIAAALAPTFEILEPVITKFANIMANTLNPILQALVPILESLFPVIQAILNVLTPIIKALLPLLKAIAPILEALFPLFKMLAIAVTYVAEVFFTIVAPILDVVGLLVKGIGYAIRAIGKVIDVLPFISGGAIIRAGQAAIDMGSALQAGADAARESAKEMRRARDEIRGVEIGGAMTDVANAAKEASENLLNIPDGYKVLLALRRFEATSAIPDPRFTGIATPPIPGSITTQNNITFDIGNIVIDGVEKSTEQVATDIVTDLQRRAQAQFGDTTKWPSVMV